MAEGEVTTSWGSRLGSSIKGVFFGFVLVLASIILLWWNEGRSVRRYKEISYAKENVVETPADSIDASKEGKLVHFSGAAKTDDVLTDNVYGVQVKDSYKLSGSVEIYQWKEITIPGKTEKKTGGSTVKHPDTYKYEKGWSSSVVNSDSFHEKVDPQTKEERRNPQVVLPTFETLYAQNVTIGAHKVPAERVSGLGSSQEVVLDEAQIKDRLPKSAIIANNTIYYNSELEDKAVKAMATAETAAAATVEATVSETTEATAEKATEAAPTEAAAPAAEQPAQETAVAATVAETASAAAAVAETANSEANVENNVAFNIANYQVNPQAPKIGDIKVAFKHNPVGDVTVIAKQTGDTFETFKIDSDLSYIDVRDGSVEAKDVFASNESSENMMVWILRIIGFIVMSSAFGMIFRPISVLADVLPILGNIAESGIGIISGLIAFVLSMLVIALAWLFYRPLLAIGLIILMGGAIFGIITLINKAKAKKAAAPAAAPVADAPQA